MDKSERSAGVTLLLRGAIYFYDVSTFPGFTLVSDFRRFQTFLSASPREWGMMPLDKNIGCVNR